MWQTDAYSGNNNHIPSRENVTGRCPLRKQQKSSKLCGGKRYRPWSSVQIPEWVISDQTLAGIEYEYYNGQCFQIGMEMGECGA